MSNYTEAQKRATMKYIKENLEEIKIRVPKGKKEEYKAKAESAGKSLTQYIIDLVEEDGKMERKYFVANNNGDFAGHDLDYATAQQCLAEMIEKEPDAGWEILSDEEE